jgi:hypothetical protein
VEIRFRFTWYNPGTLVTLVSGHMGDTLAERDSLRVTRCLDALAPDRPSEREIEVRRGAPARESKHGPALR